MTNITTLTTLLAMVPSRLRQDTAHARRGRIPRALVPIAAIAALVPPALTAQAPAPASAGGTAVAASVPAYRQASHVAVLTVEGPIDGVTLHSLERRLAEAKAAGADAVVLDIDTPGGEVIATRDICHMIREDCPGNTVAWINPNAYSAGTIIALACREIVMAPDGAFGDAAPITLVPLPQAERDKQESPLRAEVVDSARRNHYDENLVEAFISVGIELWLIEHEQTGERVFVNRAEYHTVFGDDPPDQMSPVAPPALPGAVPHVAPWFTTAIPMAPPGENTVLSEEDLRREIDFQQTLPRARPPLTAADRGAWRLVLQVTSNDRLLALKADEAIYYGLVQTKIRNDEELKAYFGAQQLTRYDGTWSEALVRFLVSWPVRIVLIIVFIMALFIELSVPGFGVFGATALAAILVLVGAPYLAGMAQWWDLLLIAAGLVLVAAELFVVPGLGITGMLGALCLLVGLVGTFVSGDLTSAQGQGELSTGVASILTALFGAGAGIWLLSRHLHSLPIINRLILRTEIGSPRESRPTHLFEAMAPSGPRLAVGAVGVAATDLRPSGRGDFEGRLLDVQSDGRYIEKGMPIRVTSITGYVIEVDADSRGLERKP